MTTNEKIIVATLELASTSGIKGATIRKIAELADVNETTIFKNFKSKDSLIINTLEVEIKKIKKDTESFFLSIKTNKNFIHDITEFILELYEKYERYILINIREPNNIALERLNFSMSEYIKNSIEIKCDELFKNKISHDDSKIISLIIYSVVLSFTIDKAKNRENSEIIKKKNNEQIAYLEVLLDKLVMR